MSPEAMRAIAYLESCQDTETAVRGLSEAIGELFPESDMNDLTWAVKLRLQELLGTAAEVAARLDSETA